MGNLTAKPKGRPRTFDYEEAQRLRQQGLTYKQIGDILGVSDNAAHCACDPGYRERQNTASRQAIEARRKPCLGGCGTLVWDQYTRSASGYCHACFAASRRVIQHGTESEYSQGCHCDLCKAAVTEARRRRRHATRVPCSHGCGTLVDSQGRHDNTKPYECRPCFYKRRRQERQEAA